MFKEIFENKVNGLYRYITTYNLKCLVLGISGGFDSTMTAILASKAAKKAGIPLIGVSLPSNSNKQDEQTAAMNVCKAFCDEAIEARVDKLYNDFSSFLSIVNGASNNIAEGNIKARVRMIILYHIAQTRGGIVLDTGNMTEHQLGFFTIHGDEGDVGLLNDMLKTELYNFGSWMLINTSVSGLNEEQRAALGQSMRLVPTDGNGTSSSDVEQFGIKSYDVADDIIKKNDYYREGAEKMLALHKKSTFKRMSRPFYISRENGNAYASNHLFKNDRYYTQRKNY